MALGMGSFGPMLATTEAHFNISRAVAATGMSAMMLALGGLAPLVGGMLSRAPARFTMIGGALISAIGYYGLALASNFYFALVMYCLIGTGIITVALLGPIVLINRWFVASRARMLSIVNLPIALLFTPNLIALLLPKFGRSAILVSIGSAFFLLILALLLLPERPPQAITSNGAGGNLSAAPRLTVIQILAKPAFWLATIGVGVVAGAGVAYVVHIVPFGTAQSLSLQAASALLSVYSAFGILGSLALGWLADRVGAPRTLILDAVVLAVIWCILPHISGAPMYVASALMGAFVIPITTLHGAALGEIFDVNSFSRAMGCSYAVKLPFIMGFAPAVGLLFQRFGGYRVPFMLTGCLLACAAISFLLLTAMSLRTASVARTAAPTLGASAAITK
jgi:MFS family permease